VAASSRDGALTDINVTPLVDVMLVLLVVMMVTASTIVTRSLSVDLPVGKTGTSASSPLNVTVTKQGQLFLDDHPVNESELRLAARRLRAQNEQAQALIAADGRTPHARVVAVLDLLRDERVNHVAVGVVAE
jgi:biopolymer transport protein ExbD